MPFGQCVPPSEGPLLSRHRDSKQQNPGLPCSFPFELQCCLLVWGADGDPCCDSADNRVRPPGRFDTAGGSNESAIEGKVLACKHAGGELRENDRRSSRFTDSGG